LEENQNEHQCNICVIKASLSYEGGKTRGMPHRVIEIPKESSLELLAIAVLAAFEFDFTHAFGFYDNLRNWTKSDKRYEMFRDMESDQLIQMYPYETGKSVRNTQVREVFDIKGKKMLFLYDYGDEWHFILQVKKFVTQDDNAEYPVLVESIGEAPSQYEFVEDKF
jgi:hypothetical protein